MLIQLHPKLRYFRTRHKKPILVVFLIFLVFFILKDLFYDDEDDDDLSSYRNRRKMVRKHEDELLRLQSQIGYLRNKLSSSSGIKVELDDPYEPVVYAITPTYARPVQKAELTRLCYTFLLVPNFHWIVVEDSEYKTTLVTNVLRKCGVSYSHLNVLTPPGAKLKDSDPSWMKPKGVSQRNEALHYIRNNPKLHNKGGGIIYFADDDNTYDLELFKTMRNIKTVGVWPVGLVGGLMVERPRLNQDDGKVIGWDVAWSPHRPFAVDMAGFAVNLNLFLSKTKAKFAYRVKRGYQESEFLKHLVKDLSELESYVHNKVLVWHTRAEKVKLDQEIKLKVSLLPPSDANIEV